MAIAFNCPHCQFGYRLRDELAGKQAKCKNPDCRKLITIPAPATVPPEGQAPARDAAALEADALSALADEVARAADAPPAEEKVIPVTCRYCEHQWTEPWSKAGKNTLCPNPECRQRVKVPEPKEDVPTDWRQQKTKLPSLAKQNFEKLEGVQDAGDVKIVSGEALKKADATGEEIEPRPLKDKVMIGLAVAGLLAALLFGVWYWRSSSVEKGEDQLMADARREFDAAAGDLTPADAGLCSAVLNAAAAEYALRQDEPRLKEAQDFFAKARDEVRKQPPGPARNAVAAELALAVLEFGGTDEQVRRQARYPWTPDAAPGRTGRLSERVHTVHEELRQTLGLLAPAEFEFKVMTARRLAGELAKRGQAGFAAYIIPLALSFTDAEQNEARAVVALEAYRADKASDVARRTAEELKAAFGGVIKGAPYPASAHTLFGVLAVDKPPQGPGTPPAAGPVGSEPAVMAYVGLRLLEGNADAALALAQPQRAGRPETQLKALALCAEWSPDPGPAVDAAAQLLTAGKGKKEGALPHYPLLRLTQLAAGAGRHEAAKALSDAIADDGLRAWAKGDAARQRAAANPKERADEGWVDVPTDAKKQRAGHAWGMLWVARQNTRESGDRAKEKKAAAAWPSAIHPFGLAGIALGLRDR